MKAIYKKEILAYSTSMIGPLFIAMFAAVMGFYFMMYNLMYGYPYFGMVLDGITFLFLITIPLLTMRSFAEEKHGHTEQLLLTSRTSITGIVLGKYLAMATIMAIPCLIACAYPLIIKAIGTAYLGTDYAAILCFFLMGCVFISIGMYISSLTESQMIAAILTFAAVFLLYLWEALVSVLPTWLANLLGDFSIRAVLDNFAENYLFDLKGLLLYLTLIAFFIFLTVQRLEKRRWN